MEKIFATRYEALSRLVELPMELTIDIISRVAVQSEDAIVDLRNLRATCNALCVVGCTATVGRRLALKRVLQHRFYLDSEYRAALINTLANVGNP
jgi:ubiquitin C-terminal hydrolase